MTSALVIGDARRDILEQNEILRPFGWICSQPRLELRNESVCIVGRRDDVRCRTTDSENIGVADHRPMCEIVLADVGAVEGIRVVDEEEVF